MARRRPHPSRHLAPARPVGGGVCAAGRGRAGAGVPRMSTLDSWTGAAEIAENVRAGRWRATEVFEAALDRVAARNGILNAFTDVTADRARARAAAIDAGAE